MAFPALARAGMAGMAIRLIDDLQAGRGEAAFKGLAHGVSDFSHHPINARRLLAVNS
jgi:hypothetical protein